MPPVDYSSTLATLRAQQAAQPLSILALAEPITSSQQQQPQPQAASRPSDTLSASEADSSSLALTPATLAADLTHYKDLFSKLRFSYLEQVTKEKYLRSIVGDPPLLVSHGDNLALEQTLATMKHDLKAKKEEVDALVAAMEERARDVAQRYDAVQEGMDVLDRVPLEIEELRREVERLGAEIAARRGERHDGPPSDPRMRMSLAETEEALAAQRARNAEVDRMIADLQDRMPARVRDVESMDRELAELERRRNEAARLAVEGRRRREEQGGRDEMEELGRWYRASEGVMKGLMGVEGTVG
ncbi:hypothetical protein G647_00627 [Cladophialophora carrionii CBS 160.54]|uniref:Kinetochore protein Sos7 coiled-coil domain-containing protein n=1 Tax=Cladophialophora carrionii CBS 160.54 TaxID=1279043 RepID=V9DPD8_9EURO|nr:uncharacterized protein G647_00627 [Cladophialophora carrionii CBS 160.54]ETI28178.1 hypothetical protein G647_00627 [Cladophialophora carrionii CBS 160.54]